MLFQVKTIQKKKLKKKLLATHNLPDKKVVECSAYIISALINQKQRAKGEKKGKRKSNCFSFSVCALHLAHSDARKWKEKARSQSLEFPNPRENTTRIVIYGWLESESESQTLLQTFGFFTRILLYYLTHTGNISRSTSEKPDPAGGYSVFLNENINLFKKKFRSMP